MAGLSAAVLCGFTVLATLNLGFGDPQPTPFIVYKQSQRGGNSQVTVYRFERTSIPYNVGNWEMINSQNKDRGEFTYVKVYDQPFTKKENSRWKIDPLKKKDHFTKRLTICEVEFSSRITTDIITGYGNCHQLSDQLEKDYNVRVQHESAKGSFYVSESAPRFVRGAIRIYENRCKNEEYEMIFSLLSSEAGCPRGTQSVDERPRAIYVFESKGTACPQPRSPSNGHVQDSHIVDNVFPDVKELKCQAGYTVDGVDRITCGRSGRWSSSLGRCIRITCPRLDQPRNGRINGNGNQYEDSVEYSCDRGYELNPPYSQERQCLIDGSWSGTEPTCDRRSCGHPGDIMYGEMQSNGERFGDEAEYRCDEGYLLEGDDVRTCTADGDWTGSLPTCTRIKCEALPQPQNGRHDATNFASGAVVSYMCHEGYKLVGAVINRCLLNSAKDGAAWTNAPAICEPIICPAPRVGPNVQVIGNNYRYGSTISFRCNNGFEIQGSSVATCTSRGTFDVEPPSCSARMCGDPGIPEHGSRDSEDFAVYRTVGFSCDHGYLPSPADAATIICLPTTRWNKQAPVCQPVQCPELARYENGQKSTEEREFNKNVTFTCFPGYELLGEPEMSCGADGQWSGQMPMCSACPKNHYKSGVNQDTCHPCPVRSLTLSEATTSIDHCLCEEGSSKEADGTCTAISCAALRAPDNGTITECGTSHQDVCEFNCEAGFILSGSRARTCGQKGWTGVQPVCTPCPPNSYKADSGSQTCIPCPINSHTNGLPGTSASDCVCKTGYKRKGTHGLICANDNECERDNGGCEQGCTDTEGSFFCRCTIPGYTLMADGKTCNMENFCSTLEQHPGHGGTTCKYFPTQNGHTCYFTCQDGYYFVSGVNDYVTCGEDTKWLWSHQVVNQTARLPACTKEFFVDTQLPINYEYTATATCNDVIGNRDILIGIIQSTIRGFEVCQTRSDAGCSILYPVFNCTDTAQGSWIGVSFEIGLLNFNENEVGTNCDPQCLRLNMRQMLGQTFQMKQEMETAVKDGIESLAPVSSLGLVLDTTSFAYANPKLLCVKDGHVLTKGRLCAPCDTGYYLKSRDLEACEPCPVGYYQPLQGQTFCHKCPATTTTASEGSDHAALCSVRETTINGPKTRKRRSVAVDEAPMTEAEVDAILAFLDE